MLLCAAAMVCSHCCQHTVSFLTVYLCFLFYFSWVFRVEYGGGPTWPCVSLVPDFGAKCATSSVGYLGGGGKLRQCVFLVPDFGAKCATSSGYLRGGPIWPCVFVPLYFGATCTTSFSVGYLGRGAYLAMHVCATVLWCHTCNLFLCGIFGGPTWPCVSVVPDFSAMRTTFLSVGYWGG